MGGGDRKFKVIARSWASRTADSLPGFFILGGVPGLILVWGAHLEVNEQGAMRSVEKPHDKHTRFSCTATFTRPSLQNEELEERRAGRVDELRPIIQVTAIWLPRISSQPGPDAPQHPYVVYSPLGVE